MFKFTLTIATSVFLLMSGAADLYAMDPSDELEGKPGKQLVIVMTEDAEPCSINHIPQDVMQVILTETSKDVNPRRLTSVCKDWYTIIRENQDPQGEELHYLATKFHHSTMNLFMQECMNAYWEKQYYDGIVQYTPTDGSQAVSLKFSDFRDGTLDLFNCGNKSQHLVITKSMDRFFKVGEENKDKIVILITLRHLVAQGIESSYPFDSYMNFWDPEKGPVGIFWRSGNNTRLTSFDSLTAISLSGIFSMNLYDHWCRKPGVFLSGVACTLEEAMHTFREFHVGFLNRNKD